MPRAMKSIVIAIFSAIYIIGRFIYKTGWIIEQIFIGLYRIFLRPVLRFLRKCTPVNVFDFILVLFLYRCSACVFPKSCQRII